MSESSRTQNAFTSTPEACATRVRSAGFPHAQIQTTLHFMSEGLRRMKVEGGSGGKRGHSNMNHWDYTEEVKRRSRKARRAEAKAAERGAKLLRIEADLLL